MIAGSPLVILALLVLMIAINHFARRQRDALNAAHAELARTREFLRATGQLTEYEAWARGDLDLAGYVRRWERSSSATAAATARRSA